MYMHANTEIVSRVAIQGYVTRGAPANMTDPSQGMSVDVEAVYEIDDDGKPGKVNILHNLTANQYEQVEAELIDAWTAAND